VSSNSLELQKALIRLLKGMIHAWEEFLKKEERHISTTKELKS